jgi:hypothetical protein
MVLELVAQTRDAQRYESVDEELEDRRSQELVNGRSRRCSQVWDWILCRNKRESKPSRGGGWRMSMLEMLEMLKGQCRGCQCISAVHKIWR